MTGNGEWTWDRYGEKTYKERKVTDPVEPAAGCTAYFAADRLYGFCLPCSHSFLGPRVCRLSTIQDRASTPESRVSRELKPDVGGLVVRIAHRAEAWLAR